VKTVGFVISHKENERRRALIPDDLITIRNTDRMYFEKGYGDILGYCDNDFVKMGANVVTREESFSKDILCNPKTPEKDEKPFLRKNQILFGWMHAVQNKEITDLLIEKKMTAIAWEKMFKDNRHVFWRNNELAGEAAIMHASQYIGKPLYNCTIAVLGKGNCATGAIKILKKLGVDITLYDRSSINSLNEDIGKYDVIVNAILWNVFNEHRIIYKDDLRKMKKGSMIIDISCNHQMEIETGYPTTIEKPIYVVDGIIHYAVDHTPAIFWKTASESISHEIAKFIDDLTEENENAVLEKATIIDKGMILDTDIMQFQRRSAF